MYEFEQLMTECRIAVERYVRYKIEQYIDKNGRTILWRRFNADEWAYNRYQKKRSEILPDGEVIYVNGKKYIHWYDCVTEYVC